MDHQEYTWSETEYALRDFIELYGKRLPLIVDVRHCMLGSDNRLHSVERGKVILVYGIDKQRRLMAIKRTNLRVSIPLNHQHKVHIFSGDGTVKQSKSVSSIERLLKKKSKFHFMFEKDQNLPVNLRTNDSANINLGSLDASCVYDERFVVGHAIRDGDVFGMDPTIIPTYVTVKMAVATGLTQGSKRAFQKLLTELHRSAKRRAKDAVLNQDIIIFPNNDADNEQAYVDPMQVIRLSLPENTYRGLLDRRSNPVTSGPRMTGPPLPPRSPSSSSGNSQPDQRDGVSYGSAEYFLGYNAPVYQPGTIQEIVRYPPGRPYYADRSYLSMGGVYTELVGYGRAGSVAPYEYPYGKSDDNPRLHELSLSRQVNQHRDSVASSVGSASTGNASVSASTHADNVSTGNSSVSQSSTGNSSVSPSGTGNANVSASIDVISMSTSSTGNNNSSINTNACLQEVFSTLDDVPLNFSALTPIEVNDCLRLLKMTAYLPRLMSRCVDGEMIVSLDEDILVAEFGFSMFDAIKMMKFAKLGYRPKNCPCAAPEADGDDQNT